VLEFGGLHILGTERHESRRVDLQLRGRAGRQGDPGSSRFFLSLEDDLMRIFGAERITGIMERLGMEEDVPIEHGLINRAIENAQKKVEGHNFDIRKNLLEYDDVMNQQRKTIYALRRQVLEGRYAPELSPEEKAAGKVAPTPTASGKHTVESLTGTVRPALARMTDELTKPPPQAPGPDGTPPPPPAAIPLDPDRFKSTIYRQFGAYLDVTGILDSRTATLDRLASEVASSLVQQRERVLDISEEVLQGILDEHCPPNQHAEDWDLDALSSAIKERFGFSPTVRTDRIMEREALAEMLWAEIEKIVEAREAEFQLPFFVYLSRYFFLEEIDGRWIEHLKAMEALREGIGLRGYGQKDPKQEYKKEGFVVFGEMMANINRNVCEKLFHVQIRREEPAAVASTAAPQLPAARKPRKMVESGGGTQPTAAAGDGSDGNGEPRPVRRSEPKVGRNDPCPCGSGKKYKKCHGATATV
jgi:preprotein translocase subunit SecA